MEHPALEGPVFLSAPCMQSLLHLCARIGIVLSMVKLVLPGGMSNARAYLQHTLVTCAGTIFQTFRLINSFRCAHIPFAIESSMMPVLHCLPLKSRMP